MSYSKEVTFYLDDFGGVTHTGLPIFIEGTNGDLNFEVSYPSAQDGWTKSIRIQLYSGTSIDSGSLGTDNDVEYQPPATWMIRGEARLQFLAVSGTSEWYSEPIGITIQPSLAAP